MKPGRKIKKYGEMVSCCAEEDGHEELKRRERGPYRGNEGRAKKGHKGGPKNTSEGTPIKCQGFGSGDSKSREKVKKTEKKRKGSMVEQGRGQELSRPG